MNTECPKCGSRNLLTDGSCSVCLWKPAFRQPPPDAGTRYIQLQAELHQATQAQAHAVLLHHDHVAGLLTKRCSELLGRMGEIEASDKFTDSRP